MTCLRRQDERHVYVNHQLGLKQGREWWGSVNDVPSNENNCWASGHGCEEALVVDEL